METIQNLLRQVAGMQWSDYLDIFLVALLIYLLLPMIKTTGTIRVVRVVVALLLITALTEALKLYTIHFLLSQILQVGLLALVVLFQPELRRMLDHLGSMHPSGRAGDGPGHYPDRGRLRGHEPGKSGGTHRL